MNMHSPPHPGEFISGIYLGPNNISGRELAKVLGVAQPRVSDLMRGKINVFGLDALVNMAAAIGLHIEMRVNEST